MKMKGDTISPPPSKRRKVSEPQPGPDPSSESLTVYSWNVNGIQPFLQRSITSFYGPRQGSGDDADTPKASLRDFLRRHEWPTMLFLQEVKVSPEDAGTIRAVEKAVRAEAKDGSREPDYVAHMCLPSDRYNARGFGRKVYGVCSIIRKDFADRCVGRVRPVSWDCEGRFLVTETKAVGSFPKLAIFNVYMVNGTDNAYKDTRTGEVTGTRHDRKLQVHELLAAECRELQGKGFGVVLAGDMNVARSALDGHPNLRVFPQQHCLNRADFEARFFSSPTATAVESRNPEAAESKQGETTSSAGLGMIDTFRLLHPGKRGYTYFPRGRNFGESCDRVDMIIVSASLKGKLVGAGMHETPGERGPSDHVPLYANFAFSEPFQDSGSYGA